MSEERFFLDLWPDDAIVWATDFFTPEQAEELLDEIHPGFALALAIKSQSELPVVAVDIQGNRYRVRFNGVIKQLENKGRWTRRKDFHLFAFKALCRPMDEESPRSVRRTLSLEMIFKEPDKQLVMAMIEAGHKYLVRKQGKERQKEKLDAIEDIPLTGYDEETW